MEEVFDNTEDCIWYTIPVDDLAAKLNLGQSTVSLEEAQKQVREWGVDPTGFPQGLYRSLTASPWCTSKAQTLANSLKNVLTKTEEAMKMFAEYMDRAMKRIEISVRQVITTVASKMVPPLVCA